MSSSPTVSQQETTPRPRTVITSQPTWQLDVFGKIWHYRELLFFLAWRDITIRYKQTLLGASWAILQPLMTMIVFSVVFGSFAQVPSDGFPYPIFSYAALLPWQYFSTALMESAQSLIMNERIITKVYFPRLVIPIASVLPGLVDFLFAFIILLVMMVLYQVPITPRLLLLPVLLLLAVAAALSIGIWMAALNVQYRDFRYVVPFTVQFMLFISPVTYSLSIVPEHLQPLYAINPMVGVITGFRWALLGSDFLPLSSMLISIGVTLGLLISGTLYFLRVENTFADII